MTNTLTEERALQALDCMLVACGPSPKMGDGTPCYDLIRTALTSLPSPPVSGEALQDRVKPWMTECFGEEIPADKLERGDRHLEEVLELLQSGDYPRERVAALTDYVYNRPKGEPSQEAGGVMITLAAYCLAHNLDMHDAGEVELARINMPEIIAKIRAKQAAKPTGSALPIALSPLTNEPVWVPISLGDAVYMEKYMRISGGSWIAFADRLSAAIGERG